MTLEEAKDILLKDMICENVVGLCNYECNECSFVTDATDMILGEAYSIVVKHYKDRHAKTHLSGVYGESVKDGEEV